MDATELRERSKKLSPEILILTTSFSGDLNLLVLAKQLTRSATSMSSNYRAACLARSKSEFVSKLSIVVEEADETLYWLELIWGSGLSKNITIPLMIAETRELLYIFSASRKTAKQNLKKSITK